MSEKENFVDTLRGMRSPAGDLYLQPTFAEQLFRWMEIVESLLKNQEGQIADYKKMIAIYKQRSDADALTIDVPARTEFPSES